MSSISRDPNLSSELAADYAALQNDLEQARCLALDYQMQLSEKSNDFALLKGVLEKTSGDLQRLQANIVALREERHRLANAAMRAIALERQLAAVTDQRNELRDQVASLQRALDCAAEMGKLPHVAQQERERPREFIDLTPEGSESVVITPAYSEPQPIRPCRPRRHG